MLPTDVEQETTPECGLCQCTAYEVDRLIKLGPMGHICLCCLSQVAEAMLPLSFKAQEGLTPDLPPAPCLRDEQANPCDNVINLFGHRNPAPQS